MSNERIVKMVPDPENPGKMVEGTVVKITSADEPISYTHLEDGSVITAKASVLEAVRIDGRWDEHGSPRYSVTQNFAFNITAPPHLYKGNVS